MADGLTRWQPFVDLADMRSRLDRIFQELGEGGGRTWSPSVDLIRGDGELVLKADLPGVKPDEVEITVEDGILTVAGEHTEETEEKRGTYLRRERRTGSFQRSLTLPEGVDPNEVEAKFADGVLEVRIPAPKREEKQKVKITPTAS